MQKTVILCALLFSKFTTFGQTNNSKEIKIDFTNGIEIVTVCTDNPQINYDQKKEYYWYNESNPRSEIKKTEGGSGGSLLNGRDQFFDNSGNLLFEKNYSFGLLNGDEKYWDSLGKINVINKYNNGSLIYSKRKQDSIWVELIGQVFNPGFKKRVYDLYDNLISEKTYDKDLVEHVNFYYQYSHKIRESYNDFIGSDLLRGRYVSYYDNGNIEVEGQYDDSLYDVRVGTWKWYKDDGTLKAKEIYKAELQKWGNGKWKVWGGYVFDEINKKWIKIGEWIWDNDEGKVVDRKKYNWGTEVKE